MSEELNIEAALHKLVRQARVQINLFFREEVDGV